VALHQALIPNWTSPAFSKFVDATRSLVDELANVTTARDGKEEMVRCEEIFRQICWLEERFWPDVDGMGEEDDSSRLGSSLDSIGAMDNMNGPMSGPMNGSMNNGPMNNGPMNNGPMNNGPMSNGPMSNGPMNGPMNGSMNGQLNPSDGTSVGNSRNSFGLSNGDGMDGVSQNS
jgi:hypothetical protein